MNDSKRINGWRVSYSLLDGWHAIREARIVVAGNYADLVSFCLAN